LTAFSATHSGEAIVSTVAPAKGEDRYFPHWKLKTGGVIMPEERLPWPQTIVSGLQHGVAMAGGNDHRPAHHGV